MPRDPRAYVWDAHAAASRILEFTRGRSLDDYLGDDMLRAAVERQFEIIGEALNQLGRLAPAVARRVRDASKIIAFRNVLVHGYAVIDHRTVWRAIQDDLPALRDHLARLLSELGEAP